MIEKLLPTMPTRKAARINTPSTNQANKSSVSDSDAGNALNRTLGRLISRQLNVGSSIVTFFAPSLEFLGS